jgi:hypothetical protein
MAKEINLRGTITIGLTAVPDVVVTCQTSGFTVTPTQNTATSPATACKGQQTVVAGESSWALAFAYVQDWGETLPGGLSQFMFDNDGAGPAYFEYIPADTTVPTATGEFTPAAGPYGGTAGAVWVASGNLPMPAAPTFTPQTV